ncbi:ABC transporter permease [Novosphingobium sp.]|uniref:ABC transporter permease n=1 Tax=Novosphingobium sp. TaxID=1874826 RepID=UPI0025D2E185|nr:ABC transporter permease [Novosphingobium sp.]
MTTKPTAGITLRHLASRPEAGSFVGMIAVYVFFALMGGANFIGAPGISSVLNMSSEVGIIALSVGLLMIAGQLDMSVGSVVPASSLTVSLLAVDFGVPDILAILGGLAVGLAIGFVNGVLVSRTRIPSLIITIGTMFGVMGLTLGLTILIHGSTGVFLVPGDAAKAVFGQLIRNMFQVSILWWAVFVAVIYGLLHVSPLGNWIFALGGDKESARNAGIPTGKLTIGLYMLSGFSAAFVGVSQVMTFNAAQVAAGQTFIFNSIMCVVIGGVLLTGGAGSVLGIVLGTLTFCIVNQGIFFSGLDPNYGSIIIGALLLIAVMTNDKFRAMALALSAGRRS